MSTPHQRHTAPPSEPELRVKALETLLIDKGLVDAHTLDLLIDTYENKIGPQNGANVVARAWVDTEYKNRLLRDASAAIAELGFSGLQGEDMVVVENTPKVHNLVVCTLSTSGRKRQRSPGRHMPSLRGVPLLPKDTNGPVFTSPWEARAFAIVVLLYQQGHFTWKEWVNALSAEIAAAKAAERVDYGSAYYELWLTAAEKLLTAKGMFLEQELRHTKAALTTESG